jgi:hypothetical protein
MPHWAPPAPTSRSGPEGIYWGEVEVSRIYYGPKSPIFGGFRGPLRASLPAKHLCVLSSPFWEKGLGDGGKLTKLGCSQWS